MLRKRELEGSVAVSEAEPIMIRILICLILAVAAVAAKAFNAAETNGSTTRPDDAGGDPGETADNLADWI